MLYHIFVFLDHFVVDRCAVDRFAVDRFARRLLGVYRALPDLQDVSPIYHLQAHCADLILPN